MRSVLLIGLAAALSFAAASARAEAVHQDKLFGFEISLPQGWRTVFAVDRGEVADRFGGKIGYIQRLTSRGALPFLFVAEKGAEASGEVRPAVKIAAHPSFNKRVRDPVTILRLISKQAARAFPEFKMLEEPDASRLGETDGAHARYVYSHRPKEGGDPVSVLCDIWLIPHESYFMQIAATSRADEKPEVLTEMLAMMQSFRQAR